MEHTSGPWKVINTNVKEKPYQIVTKEDEGNVIALIHANIYDERLDKQEARTNALLIALAPELLKACKAALDYIVHTTPYIEGFQFAINLKLGIERVISKAEGK